MRRLKKKRALFLAFFFSAHAFGAYEVGDTVGEMCWKDVTERTVCLSDAANNIRVLLYNAGYCPPCNQEFAELVPKVSQFNNQPITFISLSEAGWAGGLKPNTQFLQEWKAKHQIPFMVAASPRDGGIAFGAEDIPNVAIIDKQNKLVYKASLPGAEMILLEVRRALASTRTDH